LHLGHAWSALCAHDFARAWGGRFLLRIEDIDPGRSREPLVDGIAEDLAWLGIGWDGPIVRQSQRLPVYAAALERLKANDLVYPCFCTRAEIVASAAAPHGPAGTRYPGTCRHLAAADRAARMADEAHCWRLDMARALSRTGPLVWHDRRAGRIVADPAAHGDVVLARKDAPVSYHLAVTIDDDAQGVTDVIRGEDLFAATDVHRLLQALLGLATPAYAHHPLLTGPDGRRLAKRDGAKSLAELRADGADAGRIVAELRSAAPAIGLGADRA
jgi:glutamyl-Q tRNA(Asp) synthetase